ncbi:MAG TPA: NmrA family NAD(P)-binding protein [Caulobacteraceae bacterium]|jgi:uncharacterized protein YbjT (DUF2867 family)|nr:NmrA family NAD(P)-binding protein [Caulobacteraceae bacterium]
MAWRAGSRGGEPPFDWSRLDSWDAALEGAASVYLVAPAGVADAYSRMTAFLQSAMRKGARRFVLLSMASLPAGGPGPGQVHQWLKDNSQDWTVLRPTAFMQNFSEGPFLASIRDEDTIYSNTGTGRVPFISTVDIARAAFAALTAPAALNSDFTLTGGESISYDRVAELIGQACGRRISHTPISTAAMAKRFVDRGLPEPTAMFLAAGYQTIAEGAQERIIDGFGTLTGGTPTTFQAFADANADVWKRRPEAV